MRDFANKYKNSGFTFTPLKHWRRRMNRDIKRFTAE